MPFFKLFLRNVETDECFGHKQSFRIHVKRLVEYMYRQVIITLAKVNNLINKLLSANISANFRSVVTEFYT